MTTQTLFIQNLKCGGCANSIRKTLSKIEGVSNTVVNIEDESISFSYQTEIALEQVLTHLKKMGYPLLNQTNTLGNKAKSYISCMIGRTSPNVDIVNK